MITKLFKVLVVQKVGGDMYIKAEDKADAMEKARKLLEGMNASVMPDYSCTDNDYEIHDSVEVPREDFEAVSAWAREVVDNAEENEEGLQNLIEDEQ